MVIIWCIIGLCFQLVVHLDYGVKFEVNKGHNVYFGLWWYCFETPSVTEVQMGQGLTFHNIFIKNFCLELRENTQELLVPLSLFSLVPPLHFWHCDTVKKSHFLIFFEFFFTAPFIFLYIATNWFQKAQRISPFTILKILRLLNLRYCVEFGHYRPVINLFPQYFFPKEISLLFFLKSYIPTKIYFFIEQSLKQDPRLRQTGELVLRASHKVPSCSVLVLM